MIPRFSIVAMIKHEPYFDEASAIVFPSCSKSPNNAHTAVTGTEAGAPESGTLYTELVPRACADFGTRGSAQ